MNRWLVVSLVLLALIVLVSPGIVGRFAEKNIDEGIASTEADSPGVTITTEIFERGWFTSEGRHRVVFERGYFREATEQVLAATGNDTLPSLIIDTRVDHGLVPVTSLGRDEGTLAPGLASTASTFVIDPGDGESIEIPGVLYSTVGLTGATDSHLLLEPGTFDYGNASIQWQGTDIVLKADPNAQARALQGTIQSAQLTADGVVAGLESLSIDADQSMTEYGFSVGNADVSVTDLTFGSGDDKLSIGELSLKTNSFIDDERVSGESSFNVKGFVAPTGDNIDVDLKISIADFDAGSLAVISNALRSTQGAGDPQAALASIFPAIEADLKTLLQRGARINVDQLDVSLPLGVVSSTLAIDVPASDDKDTFSWPGVLLNMTASMDLRVPVELFDMATTMNPEAGSLLALGILKKDGTDYVMEAEYAKGLVNVNGAPMPIPLPGL